MVAMVYCRQKLFRVIGLPLMCLAMFSVAGGHWAILQTVAWAKMLGDFSRGASIEVAIMKTFSGKYPCALCRKVEKGRQIEEAPATVKVEKKTESFLCAQNPIAQLLFPRDFSYPPGVRLACIGRSDAPPFPPPRLVSI
jgi:hypothetical protein